MYVSRFGCGKGLTEPCSPYRTCQVYGVPLNEPDADGWNCPPEFTEKTNTFDLSGFVDWAEVVVFMIVLEDTVEGLTQFRFRWYRERDNALIFDYTWQYNVELAGGWVYAYCYIGYTPNEISENGWYYCYCDMSGAFTDRKRSDIEITGIPEVPPEEPPPEEEPPVEVPPGVPLPSEFWNPLIDFCVTIGNYFNNIADEVTDWVTPLNWLETPFRWIGEGFGWIAYYFSLARNWTIEAWNRILTFLSELEITDLFGVLIDAATFVWDKIVDAAEQVGVIISTWWETVQLTVQDWIETARLWAEEHLSDQWESLRPLWTWWYGFKDNFPTLDEVIDWFQQWPAKVRGEIDNWWPEALLTVQSMIDSAVADISAGLNEWLNVKDEVIEFFSDPLEWLYNKFDELIDRFW